MTLSTLPDRRAVAAPRQPALAADGAELDNSEFLSSVQRAAACLRAAGVTTGDVVATMLPGAVDLVVSLFAIWRLGATAAVIDPTASGEEASRQISDADPKALIGTERPAAISPSVRVIPPAAALDAWERDRAPAVRPGGETLALISYGGGNRALLDHRNLEAMCRLVITVFALTDRDHGLSTLPMRQLCGILLGALSPLVAGGRVTMAGPLDPESFLERIERIRPTYASAVPSLYAALSDLPGRTRPDTSSVRFALCCSAPAGTELRTEFEHRYGIPIVNGYGLREVIARAHAVRSPASEPSTSVAS
ncbi:class I adenylate-forming enzyme family protein [Nocardia araoensis]|uniref:class I adenylate-forming enzyme family protein n=1 Tax=Nocardia araoensis TaxID=228600 RepID=UPI0002E38BA9|nr:AMP-binding protein [Nocardia araoensis]